MNLSASGGLSRGRGLLIAIGCFPDPALECNRTQDYCKSGRELHIGACILDLPFEHFQFRHMDIDWWLLVSDEAQTIPDRRQIVNISTEIVHCVDGVFFESLRKGGSGRYSRIELRYLHLKTGVI